MPGAGPASTPSSASVPQGVDGRPAPAMTLKVCRRSVPTNLRSAVAPFRPFVSVGRNAGRPVDPRYPRLRYVQYPGLICFDLCQALGQVVAFLLQCRPLSPLAARWRRQFNDGCPCRRGLELGHQPGVAAWLTLMPLPPGALTLRIAQCHAGLRYT